MVFLINYNIDCYCCCLFSYNFLSNGSHSTNLYGEGFCHVNLIPHRSSLLDQASITHNLPVNFHLFGLYFILLNYLIGMATVITSHKSI